MDENSPQTPALGLKGDELEAYKEMKADIMEVAQEEDKKKLHIWSQYSFHVICSHVPQMFHAFFPH